MDQAQKSSSLTINNLNTRVTGLGDQCDANDRANKELQSGLDKVGERVAQLASKQEVDELRAELKAALKMSDIVAELRAAVEESAPRTGKGMNQHHAGVSNSWTRVLLQIRLAEALTRQHVVLLYGKAVLRKLTRPLTLQRRG